MPWHGRVSKQCERVKIIGSGEERGGARGGRPGGWGVQEPGSRIKRWSR